MAELTLLGLRVVVEVARWGSFTGAARSLGYTQSAISRQIGVVEAAVGSPLFERQARGVLPTTAGHALLRHARQVLAHIEAAEREMAGLRDQVAGHLTVSAYPTAAAGVVPRAVSRLRAEHPALTVAVWEASSPAQLLRLRAGGADVAVMAAGPGLPEYDLDGLRVDVVTTRRALGVAISADHPLAAHAEVHIDDLAQEAWIVGVGREGEPQFGPWPTLAGARIGGQAHGWPARLGLVAAGIGVTVMPGMAADIVPAGVRWLPVIDPHLVHRRDTLIVTAANRSPGVVAVVAALQDELRQYTTAGESEPAEPRPPQR
ncbi:LysR family transcriptional regulator [Paractinoplanes abujensis]|uniref:DNA-binding transcriptional LysR family regulator n=1 Tax=Paractinoplanes abujensis TaxID=882441 RepID=A0A7W7CS32_9ACTN|nr:LysR family transcriptional regulator [Actinoplanes abujensis]MBB4693319.1 DNA-binding transcriptional LysR family regulator [Actinoplanes abujensis]GID24520.1 LysR family transcriptional regulator [Actinoplanes abujensis]